jgi:hypothetical protein
MLEAQYSNLVYKFYCNFQEKEKNESDCVLYIASHVDNGKC